MRNLLKPLVEPFARDGDISRLVETVLRSNLFFSPTAYRRRVKSPIDFALGIARGLEAVLPTRPLGVALAALGQNLGQPPTAKGWEGGTSWINPATILGRGNLAAALIGGGDPFGNALDPQAIARAHGQTTPEAAGRFLLDLFLQGDLPEEPAKLLQKTATAAGDPAKGLRQLVHGLALLPEFQLA